MVWIYLFLVFSTVVTASEPHEEGHHDDAEHHGSEELTRREQAVLDSLDFEHLVERIDPEGETVNSAELAELLHLVSAGIFGEKPVEEALEGDAPGFLLLTPELVLERYGDGDALTLRQLRQSLPTILSCLTHQSCALVTDGEFIEHEEHDHEEENHEEHEHEEHDHEGHEEHDHEGHEEHEHEENEHEEHGHEEHDEHDHAEHGHEDHEHELHEDEDEEDDVLWLKGVALAVLFVEALIGSMIPMTLGGFKGLKQALSVLNCFAGGVLLSTGVIHLIPHVNEYEADVDSIGDYPLGMVVIVCGFALVFWIENVLFRVHSHTHAEDIPEQHAVQQFLQSYRFQSCLFVGGRDQAVHSVLEALVLGLEDDAYTVGVLFASIAAHKGITAMAIAARFSKANLPFKHAIALSFVFAATAPISIAIGTALSDVPALVNLILTGLSTGTFLYIGAYEVISEEFRDDDRSPKTNHGDIKKALFSTRSIKFLAIVAGIVVISGAAFIPHADHGDGHNH